MEWKSADGENPAVRTASAVASVKVPIARMRADFDS